MCIFSLKNAIFPNFCAFLQPKVAAYAPKSSLLYVI